MVVSSRSSRGRSSVRNEHELSETSSSPTSLTASSHVSGGDTLRSPIPPRQHSDAGSSNTKRNRLTSISDRESLQKRRRLSKEAPSVPPVHIPLRARVAPDSHPHKHVASRKAVTAPSLVTQESSVSNSPLDSPSYQPQYDQFKRIEEKAQKIVKKDSAREEKRKLRSEHGSTRTKTELAQYFPNFDEMLSLEPVDPRLLTAKTIIVLVDDTPNFQPAAPQSDYFRSKQAPHNASVIDLGQYLTGSGREDPLSESIYAKAHQKAERHEKQMKNGDKERAQHEKYQLERLLEELRGPDWLKTLGISGITDTEKKRYETKRTLFIREIKALIQKFKRWKEEEKRRKYEKQQQLLDEVTPDDGEHEDEKASSNFVAKSKLRIRQGTTSRTRSRANSPGTTITVHQVHDSSEVDAQAAQQLLEEAKKASLHQLKLASIPPPSSPDVTTKPFTSFFEKRYMRDAAVFGRNRGRKTYAFGHEVPEWAEEEFELPDFILTEDAIRVSQRGRRRKMRNTDD